MPGPPSVIPILLLMIGPQAQRTPTPAVARSRNSLTFLLMTKKSTQTLSTLVAVSGTLLLGGCATRNDVPQVVEQTAPRVQQVQAQQRMEQTEAKGFKRKVAIGRFSNETQYGRTFFTDKNLDPLGKQAADILGSRLVASNRFLVLERPDINQLRSEQKLQGLESIVGADALILGSVTEFGRSTQGKSGFLSSTKIQVARAKVELRLVDVRTGHVFFSASGTGEANTESGQIAGYGSKADYDGTLNDRAIAAAISDVIGGLMSKLGEREWKTDILKTEGNTVYISGGARQGIRPGETLQVFQAGEKVKSGQSGFEVALPPKPIAQIKVAANFGDSETNEGSVCDVVQGKLPANTANLFVGELKK